MKKIALTLVGVGMLLGVACGGSSSNGWTPEAKASLKSLASIAVSDNNADCYVNYLTDHVSFKEWTDEFARSLAADDNYSSPKFDALTEAGLKHCNIDINN